MNIDDCCLIYRSLVIVTRLQLISSTYSQQSTTKLKFVFFKKATKIDEIFTVDLTLCNLTLIFLAFFENMNFKNVLCENNCQERCRFCGLMMVDAMRHGDLEMISNPEALGYMCLSILHYMLHIFKHVWNIGFRQGSLITDGLNRSKWTKSLVVLAKTFKTVKSSKQQF